MTGRYRLRAAYLLASRGTVVVAVLLLVGVSAGVAAGYTYAHQDTTRTVTERTHVQTVRLTASDSALVTEETALWPRGTRLSDHPVYVRETMPTLAVTTQTSVPADADVRLRQRVAVAVTATIEDESVWTDRWPMGSRTATVTDGRLLSRTSLDVGSLADRLNGLRRNLSVPVTFSLRIEVRTRYDTGRYTGTLSTSAPLTVEERTYSVGDFGPAERTHERRVTRRVERAGSKPPTLALAAGGVAAVALAGAVVAWVTRRRVDDPERLRRRLERARFDEWISSGHVPGDPGKTTVSMASLSDLVDVAIDANRRVVHDDHRDVYAVLDGDTVYEYREAAEFE